MPPAVTAQRAAEAIKAALAAKPGVRLNYDDALRLVCEATGWPVGHVWTAGHSGWRSSGAWFDSGPQYRPLREATALTDLGAGRGIVAAVLYLESCRFLPGLDGLGGSLRHEQGRLAGLHSVVGVPVHAGIGEHRHVAAVLEFVTDSEVEPDGDLAQGLLDVARRVRLGRAKERPRPHRTDMALPEAG